MSPGRMGAPPLRDRVLAGLRREGTATAAQLGRAIGARGPSVNACLHRLEAEGLVTRDPLGFRLTKPAPVHAIDCDMDEDCTCGAEDSEK